MQEATKQYGLMWNKVQNGEISEQEWKDFCFETFIQILEDHKDIFIRLKNC